MTRPKGYAALAFALLFSAGAIAIGVNSGPRATLMAADDYSARRQAIDAETLVSLARCRTLEVKDKDLCKAQARAEERIRKADLEALYRGTVVAAAEARLARTRARLDIAKAKCGDLRGSDKYECLRAARSEKAKALTQAREAAT